MPPQVCCLRLGLTRCAPPAALPARGTVGGGGQGHGTAEMERVPRSCCCLPQLPRTVLKKSYA